MVTFRVSVKINNNAATPPNYGTFQIVSGCNAAFINDAGNPVTTIQVTSQTSTFDLNIRFDTNCVDDIVFEALVVDSLGCNGTMTFVMTNPCKNLSLATVSIRQEDGGVVIQSIVNGGIGPYTYFYDTETILADPTLPNQYFNQGVSSLGTVTVTDSNGCTQTALWTVVPDQPLTINNYTKQLYCQTGGVNNTFQLDVTTLLNGTTVVQSVAVFGSPPSQGTFTAINATTFEYVPNSGVTSGADVFQIIVTTISGNLISTITVLHTPCISVIHAEDDVATVPCNSAAVNILVLDNDTIVNAISSAIISVPPFLGTAVWDDFNYIVYTPNLNAQGKDELEYYITDIYGQTTSATLTINIDPCVPPVLAPLDRIFVCSIAQTVDVSQLITYAGLQFCDINVLVPPAHGQVVINGLDLIFQPGDITDTFVTIEVYDNRTVPYLTSNSVNINFISDCCNDPIGIDFRSQEVQFGAGYRDFNFTNTGTYKDPAIIASDVIEYSIDGGVWTTYTVGDMISICDFLKSAARLTPNCDVISTTEVSYIFNLEVCGNIGSLKEVVWRDTPGNILATNSMVQDPTNLALYTDNINLNPADIYNTHGDITAQVTVELSNGYMHSLTFVFESPYTSATDPATCPINMPTEELIGDEQYPIQVRRTLTYGNNCLPIVKLYDVDIIDPNQVDIYDQNTPYANITIV